MDRPPTEDDLAYHLTTLFPPVRPRGWFEVRYLDAQHPRWWPVPVVLLATAVDAADLDDRPARGLRARHGRLAAGGPQRTRTTTRSAPPPRRCSTW